MPIFKPFAAIRPKEEFAAQVSCLPYDVMSRKEAVKMAEGKDRSFLHVVRSEIDFEKDVDAHSQIVYERARDNLIKMQNEGTLERDKKPMYYIYRLTLDGRSQTGIAGCAAIDDYINGRVKKHEFTRFEKELDRINNFYHCNADTEPVFLTYRSSGKINQITEDWIREHTPVYDFMVDDRFGHTLWVIEDDAVIAALAEQFEKVDNFYIADGHHRSVSAAEVGKRKRQEAQSLTGEEAFNFFMAVSFPDDQLRIMAYNRVLRDLNGLSKEEFLMKIKEKFEIEEKGRTPYEPEAVHTFSMYMEGMWYKLTAVAGTFDANHPVAKLDCSILQDNLLAPVLGIEDPRADERIDFVGGIRGTAALKGIVEEEGMKLAFALYPVSLGELIEVADLGEIMPPKSTWFEPKLRSGLFIHDLS